jgi:hypothetical protein
MLVSNESDRPPPKVNAGVAVVIAGAAVGNPKPVKAFDVLVGAPKVIAGVAVVIAGAAVGNPKPVKAFDVLVGAPKGN